MLTLRPTYLILLVGLLSVVGASPTCKPPTDSLPLDKEAKRFAKTLLDVQNNLNTLKNIKSDKDAEAKVLNATADAQCQMVTLTYSRNRIIKEVGGPFAFAIHKYTDKPFENLTKGFVDFQKKTATDAVRDAAGFADGQIKLISDIKKYTDQLSQAKKSSGILKKLPF
ncbi:hypothetical protein DFH28DRAFT_240974 [Melampsora americana]|nr:hypothetical protein DFH28DRAFT_240974 [Melampsora americana]